MKMILKTAIANMKYHKGKNILTGIAIFLTCLLLLVVPTVGKDMIDTQFAMVNKLYPTWHALYRGVSEEQTEQLSAHHDISVYGLRSDAGYFAAEHASIAMMYLDKAAMELYKIELQSGDMPEKADEIVLSEGILKELGVSAALGQQVTIPYQIWRDNGLDVKQERTFTLVGLLPDSEESIEVHRYTALVSKSFVQEEQEANQITYSFLFQVEGDKNVTTDDIETNIKDLAKSFGINENNISINTAYLAANYVDPVFTLGIVVIMLIIMLAGIITIYSIYYVAMAQRVQELGKLKAIGTTKKQLRQLVLWEGFAVAGIAIPVGLITGSLLVKWILRLFVSFAGDNNILEIVNGGEVPLLHGWIYILAIVITLVTVYLSLLAPMKKASKVSEIEAMKYQGEQGQMKSRGKGYTFMSTAKLTKTYLAGNRKRSMMTILSMSITGVFLMVIATVLSCADPEISANNDMLGQYEISPDVQKGNKEHPEREWSAIMQNNPLTEELLKEVQALNGVERVDVFSSVEVECDIFDDDIGTENICGVPEEYARKVEAGIEEGHVTYEELKTGDKAVIASTLLYWYPDLKVGDILHLQLKDGDSLLEQDVEIAAIGDYEIGFTNYDSIIMAQEALDRLVKNNAQRYLHVYGTEPYNKELEEELLDVMSQSELLSIKVWKKVYEQWKDSMAMLSSACYIFLGVLSAICIMNLINTMMNSIHIRKKELGMLQAIGMTNRQLTGMLWREGMFYTFGTLIISVGIGSLLGYPVYLWMKSEMMLNISQYHYPWTVAILVVVTMVVLQCILSVALSHSVQKDSLIERIRFNE